MTELKSGDRVRVTRDGEVVEAKPHGDPSCVNIQWQDNGLRSFLSISDPRVVIEKLADPEPVWVNGDVIRVRGDAWLTYVRMDGHWYNGGAAKPIPDNKSITTCWHRGEVSILYKADA